MSGFFIDFRNKFCILLGSDTKVERKNNFGEIKKWQKHKHSPIKSQRQSHTKQQFAPNVAKFFNSLKSLNLSSQPQAAIVSSRRWNDSVNARIISWRG